MPVRLVVTITAAAGKGSELAKEYRSRAANARKEPGCEQFEAFQGIDNPDTIVLLERWVDQTALDTHAQQASTRAPLPPGLREGSTREDYDYNRTR